MTNDIPKRFLNSVKTTPTNIDLKNRYTAQQYGDLYATLKLIKATESVQLTTQEAIGLFGKCYKQNITVTMKRRGLKRPKCVTIKGTVYITNCDV